MGIARRNLTADVHVERSDASVDARRDQGGAVSTDRHAELAALAAHVERRRCASGQLRVDSQANLERRCVRIPLELGDRIGVEKRSGQVRIAPSDLCSGLHRRVEDQIVRCGARLERKLHLFERCRFKTEPAIDEVSQHLGVRHCFDRNGVPHRRRKGGSQRLELRIQSVKINTDDGGVVLG